MKNPIRAVAITAVAMAVSVVGLPTLQTATSAPSKQTYIVLLKQQPAGASAQVSAVTQQVVTEAAASGARVSHEYRALGGFAAELRADQAASLARDPRVARVVPDFTVRLDAASTVQASRPWPTNWPTSWPTMWPTSRPTITAIPTITPRPTASVTPRPTITPTKPGTPTPSVTPRPTQTPTVRPTDGGFFPAPDWGLDRVNQRQLPLDRDLIVQGDGAGVHVYVLDTGIRTTHEEFAGRVGNGYDFVNKDDDPQDDHNFISVRGHGSMVASIAAGTKWGVAKKATVHGVKVLDSMGNGRGADVIAGIDWVTANAIKPAVVNMSMVADRSDVEDEALRRLMGSGVVLVAAAGNDNNDACKRTPAGLTEAITVSAINDKDAIALPFANWGPCVDVFAPGFMVSGASNSSDSAGQRAQGTSQAAPYGAGAAALYLAKHPQATQAEVHQAIVDAATPNVVKGELRGAANRVLYVNGFGG